MIERAFLGILGLSALIGFMAIPTKTENLPNEIIVERIVEVEKPVEIPVEKPIEVEKIIRTPILISTTEAQTTQTTQTAQAEHGKGKSRGRKK